MRPVTPAERAVIAANLDAFGADLLSRWEREREAELWTRDARPQPLYLVAARLGAALRASASLAPTAAGLFLGELDGDTVHYSLEGAFEIGRRSRAGKVLVNDKGASLFLYGRDILGESIRSSDPRARVGTIVFVARRPDEVLGLAEVLQPLPGRGPSLKPLADRGWYLREGG